MTLYKPDSIVTSCMHLNSGSLSFYENNSQFTIERVSIPVHNYIKHTLTPHTLHTGLPTATITAPPPTEVINVITHEVISSDEESVSPLVSLQSIVEDRQNDNIIPIQLSVQSESITESHDQEPPDNAQPAPTPSIQITTDPSAARQHGEDDPVISESPSYRRQQSHPQTSFTMIRQTLHSRRHASFHGPRTVSRTVDFIRSMNVPSEASASTTSSLTETLPPSE